MDKHYSKQYLDNHPIEGVKPAFDIDEVGEQLEDDKYTSIECDGYAFIGIGKIKNRLIFAIPVGEEDGEGLTPVQWLEYEEVVK